MELEDDMEEDVHIQTSDSLPILRRETVYNQECTPEIMFTASDFSVN